MWASIRSGTRYPIVRQPRHVRGTRRASAGAEVTLCGWQVASNAVERPASVTSTDVQLDAAALRQLAAMACAYETDQHRTPTDWASNLIGR